MSLAVPAVVLRRQDLAWSGPLELSPGAHVLGVAGRSHGVKIDAIRIYLKGTEPPSGG